MKTPYILCSAIWYKDLPTQPLLPNNCDKGIVVCGWRHGNIIQTVKTLTNLRTVKFGDDAVGETEQGFLTNDNIFVNRKEAGEIAFNAGQTNELKTFLFSEDIW